jgi:hypothetical protein
MPASPTEPGLFAAGSRIAQGLSRHRTSRPEARKPPADAHSSLAEAHSPPAGVNRPRAEADNPQAAAAAHGPRARKGRRPREAAAARPRPGVAGSMTAIPLRQRRWPQLQGRYANREVPRGALVFCSQTSLGPRSYQKVTGRQTGGAVSLWARKRPSKSLRHPGEGRGPVFLRVPRGLDSGLRRNDGRDVNQEICGAGTGFAEGALFRSRVTASR